MNILAEDVAKKTGLSKYEIDAILKVAALTLIENTRQNRATFVEGLGFFSPLIGKDGLNIKFRTCNMAKTNLNKKFKEERKDEIIFE